MKLKTVNLNIRASTAEKAMLEQVEQANETTPSEMMRQLIREAHAKLQENTMQIVKNQNKIVVSGYGKQYAVDENDQAYLGNGNESEMTVGEAHAAGLLRVINDPEGKTHGMHGALYVQ